MPTTEVPLRHAYDSKATVPPLTDPLASFPHALGLGTVEFHKDPRPDREWQQWVVYPRRSLRKGEEGQVFRYACPVTEGFTMNDVWGKEVFHQCHTPAKDHPWNNGAEIPGSHRCGACGFFTWHEIHGVADGHCLRCGYHG